MAHLAIVISPGTFFSAEIRLAVNERRFESGVIYAINEEIDGGRAKLFCNQAADQRYGLNGLIWIAYL